MIQNVRVWLREVTELGLLLVALSVVLQILFGASVPFVGGDVVGNITGLIATLGQNGLVGLDRHRGHPLPVPATTGCLTEFD